MARVGDAQRRLESAFDRPFETAAQRCKCCIGAARNSAKLRHVLGQRALDARSGILDEVQIDAHMAAFMFDKSLSESKKFSALTPVNEKSICRLTMQVPTP